MGYVHVSITQHNDIRSLCVLVMSTEIHQSPDERNVITACTQLYLWGNTLSCIKAAPTKEMQILSNT